MGTDPLVTQYQTNQAQLVQYGLAAQKGPQTDQDALRELAKYGESHFTEAGIKSTLDKLADQAQRAVYVQSNLAAGYVLTRGEEHKEKPSVTSGNEEVLEWSDYK
jgi:acyl transferase domain-containing protein